MSKFTLPEGYELSEDGEVYSTSGWRGIARRRLAQTMHDDGYLYVTVKTEEGKRERRFIHKLITYKYYGPKPSPTHQIRHLNDIKTDNRPENLRWGTVQENAFDRVRNGTQYRIPWNDPDTREKMTTAIRRYHALAKADGKE